MTKINTNKTTPRRTKRKTTTDLILRHVEKYLLPEEAPQLPKSWWERMVESGALATTIFAFSGAMVLMVAFYLVTNQLGDKAFVDPNAADYAAQQAFYANSVAMNFETAKEAVHAAATTETSDATAVISFIGFLLVAFTLAFLFHEQGYFNPHKAKFGVRRIGK